MLTTVNQLGGAVGVTVVGLALIGLLGSTARTAVADYTPQIEAAATSELRVAPGQLPAFSQAFEKCFVARIEARDPGSTIPGCLTPTPALLSTPLGRVGSDALAATFVRSEETALLINLTVFVLAFLLVLALPRSAGEQREAMLEAAA